MSGLASRFPYYVGVFDDPVTTGAGEGGSWDLPGLHLDVEQDVVKIECAFKDDHRRLAVANRTARVGVFESLWTCSRFSSWAWQHQPAAKMA
jgi:hypothetical protein